MKKRERWNLLLHIAIGGVLAALAMWHPFWIIFDTFIYAFLREQAQHRFIHGDKLLLDGVPVHTVQKRTFFDFGWLGWKQVFEIGQWTFGSAVVVLPWHFFG
jgi:hypothetical protein